MPRPILTAPAVLLLLLSGFHPAGAIQLRYKFRKGEVATLRTMLAAAGQAESTFAETPMRMQMRVDVISTERVLSVGANGTAQIESKDLSGTNRTTTSGRTQTTKVPLETTIYTLTNRGRLVRYRQVRRPGQPQAAPEEGVPGAGPPGFENSDPLKALYGLNFPARDLQPGDTWNTESKVDIGEGKSVVVKIASRFAALTTFQGRRCARIVTAFEMPTEPEGFPEEQGVTASQEGKVTGQITSYFDVEAGREIYADGSIVMLAKMQMSGIPDPTGATSSAEMNSVFKMNLRQTLLKSSDRTGGRRP